MVTLSPMLTATKTAWNGIDVFGNIMHKVVIDKDIDWQ